MTETSMDPSGLRRALEAQAAQAQPDFAAVLARVTSGADEESREVGEAYVDLGEPDAELAEACEALRERLEEELLGVLDHPRSAPSFGSDRGPNRWFGLAVVMAGVAAAALLFWLRPQWMQAVTAEEGAASRSVSVDAARGEDEGQRAMPRVPRGRRGRSAGTSSAQAPTAVAESEDEPEDETGPPTMDEPERSEEPAAARGPVDASARVERSRPRPVSERIATLDARAQARWAAGDVAGAAADFRTIVRIGGRRKSVELAYAELFALARQRGEDRAALWRAYLRRFPRGRYAKEASAGLCRSAQASEREACWDAHRRRFPGANAGARE